MSMISRTNEKLRSEKGGDWFNDFLNKMSKENPSTLRDIMTLITDKKQSSVNDVVQEYRKQVGLDAVAKDDIQVKEAQRRPLSIRHAQMQNDNLSELIKYPEVEKDIENLCMHSAGTKSTMSIINHLREKFEHELASLNNKELKEYIDKCKEKYYIGDVEDEAYDVGLVGQENADYYDDNMADYQRNDGTKK